ncbi:MAG TPA: putative metallopeptidase [Phycisphaerae bacterium]|nr:putative metallopeptidase [Phycisphaerae bacterium]
MGKPKPVTVELIEENDSSGERALPYRILDEFVRTHHPHLAEAKIALAWNDAWAEDADGKVQLGQAKKASDLDRELHGHDLVILLNRSWWNQFQPEQQRALMDHELCHCEVAKDDDGETKQDEKGRIVYRIRKHDVEEFREVVARHGVWKSDLEQFVATAKDANTPLFRTVAKGLRSLCPKEGDGVSSITLESGGKSVTLTPETGKKIDKMLA